jgi:hypothetical protein
MIRSQIAPITGCTDQSTGINTVVMAIASIGISANTDRP